MNRALNESQLGGLALADRPVWGAMNRLLSVQIFGAEEAIGREVAVELLRAGHPLAGLRLFGDEAKVVGWQGQRIQVYDQHALPGAADLAFVCTDSELGGQLVARLTASGTRVIDLSGASKANPDVPLVVGGTVSESLGPFTQLVAMPTRSSVALALALQALEGGAGITGLDIFATIAAVSEGTSGVQALRAELASHAPAFDGTAGRDPSEVPNGSYLTAVPHPSGGRIGNLRPARGEQPGGAFGDLESELIADLKRILARPDLPLGLVALEGCSERCDAFVVRAGLRTPLESDAIAGLFRAAPGFRVYAGGVEPLPQACGASEEIHVGRIRAGSGAPGSLCFFLVADQLRAGAASAALRVGAHLTAGGP